MKKTAIILGASGVTGNALLQLLIKDDRYEKIKLFSRSKSTVSDLKIEEFIINLFELEKHKDDFTADEVYCCLGTTKAKTPDKTMYHNIDFGIPVTAAQLSKENGIGTFIVISAIGANKNSSVFYNRTKGEMEEAVLRQKITNTYILQPSLIITNTRKEQRIGERVAGILMKIINPLLVFKIRKYRSITPQIIAKAMLWLANNSYNTSRIQSDILQKIGGSN